MAQSNMGWRNKFTGHLLILNWSLLIYLTNSFPIFPIYYDRDPEFGPFFQGDIIGDPDDRSGIPSEGYRWPQGHVLFFVQDDYSFQEMETIYKAVMEIIGSTCITVEELLSSSYFTDHIYYTPDKNYCASPIGRRGKRQYVNLGKVCLTDGPGKAVHETIHALGFYHEHTREDRDRFVKINIDNVILNKRKNFAILPSNDFDVPYDYGSIMHYPDWAFAIDAGQKTIEVLQPGVEIGQRVGMSPSDKWKINLMYEKECHSKYASGQFQAYLSQQYG